MKMWITLFAILALAGPTTAAEINKPKLRQLARLPEPENVGPQLGFSLTSSRGFTLPGEKSEPPLLEIERIRKELKGEVSDAGRYARLGFLYEKINRKKDAEDAKTRAVVLYRQQVKEHPHNMRRLAELGDFLFFKGETKEGEAMVRRALKEAPNDWQIWGVLGDCLDRQATRAISMPQYMVLNWSAGEMIDPEIFDKKPTAEQIAEWRRLHKEACGCFDRAVELAPREPKPYLWRLCSLSRAGVFEAGLRKLQGEQVYLWKELLQSACTEDTRQYARLSPNDPKAIGGAVVVELLLCMTNAQSNVKEPIGMFGEPIPKPSLEFVSWGTHRLEELAKSGDKRIAASASEILARVLLGRIAMDTKAMNAWVGANEESEMKSGSTEKSRPPFTEALGYVTMGLKMMNNIGQIEENFRRAIKLDPTRELSWDMLSGFLYSYPGRTKEAIALCEQRLKLSDNAHNRYCLAYGYAGQRQYNQAVEQLRAAMKYNNKSVNCRLGLAAVFLQRSEGDDLKQAGELLEAVASRITKAKKKSRIAQYHLLRGLHAALSDRPNQAKEQFRIALQQDMGKREVAEALIAAGIPITPGDESLAIAYLQTYNAEIERKSKKTESPVAKISSSGHNMADVDLYFLSAFSQLSELKLSSYYVTDAGMAHLEALNSLRRLQLNSQQITDAGLTHLHKLKRLESVKLHGTNVTNKGIAELRKVFPKLDISR